MEAPLLPLRALSSKDTPTVCLLPTSMKPKRKQMLGGQLGDALSLCLDAAACPLQGHNNSPPARHGLSM